MEFISFPSPWPIILELRRNSLMVESGDKRKEENITLEIKPRLKGVLFFNQCLESISFSRESCS